MNLSDILIGAGVIFFASIFTAIGIGLIYRRFKDRGSEKFEGEVVGNEWKCESAEMGGSFHPLVQISEGSETFEFIDQCGQIPARQIGELVEVVRDKESGEFRVLQSWLLAGIIGLLFMLTGLATIVLTLRSCHPSHENGANKMLRLKSNGKIRGQQHLLTKGGRKGEVDQPGEIRVTATGELDARNNLTDR